MQDFHPPTITVTWEADGTTISTSVETTKPIKHNDKYMASSYLTVDPAKWESHQSFSCKVTHERSDYVKSILWKMILQSKCNSCLFLYGMCAKGLSLLGGTVGFLYSFVSLWYVFGGGTTLTVSGQPPSPPIVHLFPPSTEEKESKNKATLVCLMQDFHPPAITVTWEADGTTISTGVETTKPIKHNDKYMASSYLMVDPAKWESHQSFSCKVTHERSDYVKSVSHSQCP
ncbi:immunoglobulin lambda-like polypeptide 5 [Heteronotia binoei]|uniref:immunoglobulin lambda-like polypeptide 5 n=1 Tax=Heteronotia binoei TaxID=13085 RepID=UPI00292D26A9|nr:immunoglobulin lambda-like polypeptide 5 [Heteronotia binoei]